MQKYQISVELTNKCNMQCKMCPHSVYRTQAAPSGNVYNRKHGFMSGITFDAVLANAQYYREVVLGFFGEQTLHPKLAEYSKRLRAAGSYRMVLNTNWSVVTAKMMEDLYVFDLVRISIDASNGRLYEKLCPGTAFKDLNGCVARNRYAALVEKIDYWLALSGHPETWLVYVVSTLNNHDKERFVSQWLPKTPQSDSVVTKRVVSYGGVMHDKQMSKHPCRIPEDHRLVVAWNGDISPCNLDVNMALRVGNVNVDSDVHKLVTGSRWSQTLQGIRSRSGICARCFDSNNHTKNVRRRGKLKVGN